MHGALSLLLQARAGGNHGAGGGLPALLCHWQVSGLVALGTRVRGRERKDPNRACPLQGAFSLAFEESGSPKN